MEDNKELCEACNGKGVLNEINGFTFGDVICPICVNKEKQETLEKAAKRTEFERYGKTLTNYTKQRPAYNLGFNNGAKWQAKRMYSEEEVGELVYNIIGEYGKHYGIMIDGAKLNDLFEQFKKK
jgi:hypothetical protein